jgi:hypothetical protein
VQVVSSPLYDRESDRMVGVLAFVNSGDFSGKILVHIEE